MKIHFILIFCLLSDISSCAQTPKNMNIKLISDLYKEVKYKDKKRQYHAGIQVGGVPLNFSSMIFRLSNILVMEMVRSIPARRSMIAF